MDMSFDVDIFMYEFDNWVMRVRKSSDYLPVVHFNQI